MSWWQWTIAVAGIVWVGWGIVFALLEHRAGTLRSSLRGRYADGCPRPIIERAFRSDGSPKNILPRRGDAEIEELEHRWDHE